MVPDPDDQVQAVGTWAADTEGKDVEFGSDCLQMSEILFGEGGCFDRPS